MAKSNELVKCDACNSYHPAHETEVVVIKLRKGVNCALGNPIQHVMTNVPQNGNNPSKTQNTASNITPTPGVSLEDKTKLPSDIIGAVNPDAPARPKPRSIVPPHLRGIFIEQGQPGAAEEKRIV